MDNQYAPRKAKLWEALVVFSGLVLIMCLSILKFKIDPHIPMFVGVIFAALMAMHIGYRWSDIESAMVRGISQALPSIMILITIGILVGIWIATGVVPSMIYYGLNILKPSIFLVAACLICSITSLATGSSWGTAATMGIALMGIAQGLHIPAPVTAGAILSGAYFGDKMSPLSDTTNLAPAMAGTDVFTHVKAMIKPTVLTYVMTLIVFAVLTSRYSAQMGVADVSGIRELQEGLKEAFVINPILLLPPIVVIVSIAFKIPALPGIVLGIIVATIIGPIVQPTVGFQEILGSGMNGYISETGVEGLDKLLTAGGLMNMMESVSLTLIAMMFGGIAERTGQLEVIVGALVKGIRSVTGLVTATLVTCLLSNMTMPEQYISLVVPGRMFAPEYKRRGLHPKLLSSTLESSGTVTSALVPWNTCGVYMKSVLHVSPLAYMPFAVFNYLMPFVVIILTAIGQNVFYIEDDPGTVIEVE
ncbi:MAG: Na+/H+ antiporter NhaC [Peptoniphilus sp.]|nr:Na+/H+ antiporter NhaC [Peptoniphilus sp.]MDD7363507.1 Na+/H+ antiporter NhaC [Bacillota bacterium]MDY6044789.1 Na+/H+ antiporter NhaC [Peptoniphilus sp.]